MELEEKVCKALEIMVVKVVLVEEEVLHSVGKLWNLANPLQVVDCMVEVEAPVEFMVGSVALELFVLYGEMVDLSLLQIQKINLEYIP